MDRPSCPTPEADRIPREFGDGPRPPTTVVVPPGPRPGADDDDRNDWHHGIMAASSDRPDDSPSERPSPETSRRRPRRQCQLDFEIDFFGRCWSATPASSTPCGHRRTTWRRRGGMRAALQLDRRLVRLIPEDEIAWYNLACTYTVLGMIDPGFFALERAMELGYTHIRPAAPRPGPQGVAPRPEVRPATPPVRAPILKGTRDDSGPDREGPMSPARRVRDVRDRPRLPLHALPPGEDDDASRVGSRSGSHAGRPARVGPAPRRSGSSWGRGWARWRARSRPRPTIPYPEIPHFPALDGREPQGAARLRPAGRATVMAMEGRFHLYEGYSPCAGHVPDPGDEGAGLPAPDRLQRGGRTEPALRARGT